MHYLAKKFETYFYTMYLCRNLFYLFFLHLRYGKRYLFLEAGIVFLPPGKKSFLTHWNLDGKLFVVDQSRALGNFASGHIDRDLVTEMSKDPCYMDVSLPSPGPRGQCLV